MARIFSIIAAISALMVILSGLGAYWFSSVDAKSAKQEAASLVARNLATSLSIQLNTLQASVDGLAQSPDVVSALSSGNPELIQATAAKLQTLIPYSLKIRLLLPDIEDSDQTERPNMGFGDLEMVRSTLTAKQHPVIQGDAEHRHLAITSAVHNGDQIVGVVLASLKPDLPKDLIKNTPIENGFIELKQDQLVLAAIGESDIKDDDPTSVDIAHSRWKINAWTGAVTGLREVTLLFTIVAIPALLACLAFFVGYRKLSDFLRSDQGSMLKAAKDMLQGKHVGNYPMHIEEMQPLIAAMAQFKRVMGQQEIPLGDDTDELGKDFFEESFDIDFMEESTPISTSQMKTVPISVAEMPLTMPTADKAEPLPPTVPVLPGTEARNISLAAAQEELPEFVIPSTTGASDQAQRPSIFREFDILGIAGKDLNETIVGNIGRAFASEAADMNIKTIVVAQDGRISSPGLGEALIKGITSAGCDVLDIGLSPTPVLNFVSHHSEGRTGIMVSGGDAAAEYNGLKLVVHGEPVSGKLMQAIKDRISRQDYAQAVPGSVDRNTVFSNEYIGIISEDTHIVRPMTIVVDCANGATAQLGPMLLKTIGCDVVELYCDIDGHFPNHAPDPGNPGNLDALVKAVKLNNADAGIAFDGDGERMTLIDSGGRIVWADRQLMLFARNVLSVKPSTEIIYDAACSSHLPEQIKKRGGFPVLCKSGAAPLQKRLRETGAAMAGDFSGHFLFNDRWFGFSDALYAAVRMIEILSADMRSSSELFDELPKTVDTPEYYVALAEGESLPFIEHLFSRADLPDGDIINIEGMRVEFPEGWGLIKDCANKPGLALRFEANSQEALHGIQTQFKQLLLHARPELTIPF